MESNADKHMREKLKGLEYAFEPAAWDQMEAMLDKKKKRRGIFWWWFGGAAALLVLAVGGYLLLANQHPTKQLAVKPTEQTTTIAQNGASGSVTNTTAETEANTTYNTTGTTTAEKPGTTTHTTPATATALPGVTSSNTTHTKKFNTTNTVNNVPNHNYSPKGGVATNGKHYNNEHENDAPIVTATGNGTLQPGDKSKKKAEKEQGKKIEKLEEQTGKLEEKMQKNIQQMEALRREVEMLKQAAVQNDSLQAVVTPLVIDTLLAAGDTTITDTTAKKETAENSNQKKEETTAAKKKIFTYQLGIRADVMGAVASGGIDTLKEKNAITPVYRVGLFQEMLLWKRLSLYTGVLYAYSSFKINSPTISNGSLSEYYDVQTGNSYYYQYKSYESRTHELVFPIGIKGYIINKPAFNFFVHAGVLNHVKLKEELIVQTSTQQNMGTALNQDNYTETSVADNPFSNDIKTVNNANTSVNTYDLNVRRAQAFAISGTKRYYASFYASLGVEYIIKNKYHLIAEPAYSLVLSHIGEQEKRKLHNFGLTVGFKYSFGK